MLQDVVTTYIQNLGYAQLTVDAQKNGSSLQICSPQMKHIIYVGELL